MLYKCTLFKPTKAHMKKNAHYDIIIIGAGIQGSGVAQATAGYGYKTLVIEKFSQAGLGTSCKSSKLIHGGLRYLESKQFKLVHECLQERKLLLKNAPQLVKIIPFYIPVYSHSLRPIWLIQIGLFIYSLFSFKPFSIIKKEYWHKLDNIDTKNLKTVFKYYDAQTDDKQLTQAVIHSAEKLGATVEYNADFLTSRVTNNQHVLTYLKNNEKTTVTCQCIINCSGPWITSTQNKISPQLELPDINLVAGTHIIINKPTIQGAYYIEATDKRAVFVMPWKEQHTLIGTTERVYTGNADDIQPTTGEINYLLDTYNRYFKTTISTDNIIDSFSGLRVLPGNTTTDGNESAFNKPRESLLIHNHKKTALITLIGGKLTIYRLSAEEVLQQIKQRIGPPEHINNINTRDIRL